MSETWFKVVNYSHKIETAAVIHSSPKTVTMRHFGRVRRINRVSAWQRYFPTWQEAYAYLHDRVMQELRTARDDLDKAQGALMDVELMAVTCPFTALADRAAWMEGFRGD